MYSYRSHPFNGHSFLIVRADDGHPVGEYTILDFNEPRPISEKKIANLVSLLNNRPEDVIELGEETRSRLLFHRVPAGADSPEQRIVFQVYDGTGISRENALLTLNKEVPCS